MQGWRTMVKSEDFFSFLNAEGFNHEKDISRFILLKVKSKRISTVRM